MENSTALEQPRSTYVMMALNLEHKKLLIVGGGPVAYKRFKQWQGRGAEIHVVAPEFCEAFKAEAGVEGAKETRSEREGVHLHRRGFMEQDLEGVWMVYVATRDEKLNEAIEALCRKRAILWGRGDSPDSEVQSVAMIERGAIQIGVSTGGQAPAAVAQIKEKIEMAIDLEEIEAHIDRMQKLKLRLKSEMPDQAQRALLLRKAAQVSLEELEQWLQMDSLFELDKLLP